MGRQAPMPMTSEQQHGPMWSWGYTNADEA